MITIWWTLCGVGLLAFVARVAYDSGERSTRRALGRPEFQETWGSEDDIAGHGRE